jgi:hypothetical protein
MEQLYADNAELSARAAFYDSLSSLQAELLSDHGVNARLVDALRLMPQHGFAWFWFDDQIVLAHCKGHKEVDMRCSAGQCNALPFLLGLPSCLDLDIDDKPTTSPAPAVTSPAQPTTSPAAEPEPEPEPEPEAATEADPSHSHEPLAQEDWLLADGLIKALQVAPRKKFVAAFRAAFDIPKETQTSAAITEMRHLVFIQRFVNEAEGVPMP